jgi:uncharacterized membrane protein SirB2
MNSRLRNKKKANKIIGFLFYIIITKKKKMKKRREKNEKKRNSHYDAEIICFHQEAIKMRKMAF